MYTVYYKRRERSVIFAFTELRSFKTTLHKTYAEAQSIADAAFEANDTSIDAVTVVAPVGNYQAAVLYKRERWQEETEVAMSEHGELDYIPVYDFNETIGFPRSRF